MNKKNLKKLTIIFLFCIMAGIGTFQITYADTEDDLEDTQDDLEDLEDAQDDVEDELDSVTDQLAELMSDISTLETNLEVKESEISDAQAQLEEAEEEQEEQYEAMKLRIQYMYENEEDSYMDLILESGSIADLINSIEYINEVYDYDRDLLDDYEATTQEIEDLNDTLEEEMADLESMQDDYTSQQEELETLEAELEEEDSDYDDQIAEAQEKAEDLQDEIEEEEAAEAAAAAEEEDSSSSSSSDTASSDSDPDYTTDVSGTDVANYALTFVGYSYVWGTSGPTTFDCSGFIYYVYNVHFGIDLAGGRTSSSTLATLGEEVSYSNAEAGDLVCYYNSSGTIHHVAIYIGDGQIVHAKGSLYGVVTDSISYSSESYTIRRVL